MATLPLQIRNTEPDNRYDYCRCGCGQKTSIPKYGDVSKGWVRGIPLAYCNGHFTRKGKRYEVDPATGCWNWLVGLNPSGYATVRANNKSKVVYRWLFQILNGPVPKDMDLDHTCRNRRCVNPEHLEVVTHTVNMRRSPVVTKLDEAKVVKIKKLLAQGNSHRTIAPLFGVTKATITSINLGRTWKEIPIG